MAELVGLHHPNQSSIRHQSPDSTGPGQKSQCGAKSAIGIARSAGRAEQHKPTGCNNGRDAMKLQRSNSGSVLIIVLWIALGLVTIAIYFAHSMSFEMRASENRVAAMQSEQAVEGAAQYVS